MYVLKFHLWSWMVQRQHFELNLGTSVYVMVWRNSQKLSVQTDRNCSSALAVPLLIEWIITWQTTHQVIDSQLPGSLLDWGCGGFQTPPSAFHPPLSWGSPYSAHTADLCTSAGPAPPSTGWCSEPEETETHMQTHSCQIFSLHPISIYRSADVFFFDNAVKTAFDHYCTTLEDMVSATQFIHSQPTLLLLHAISYTPSSPARCYTLSRNCQNADKCCKAIGESRAHMCNYPHKQASAHAVVQHWKFQAHRYFSKLQKKKKTT